MKKRIITFLVVIGLLIINQPILNVFAAEEIQELIFESPDQIFESTINDFEEYQDSYIEYEKKELYDINLNECGYFYTFSIDDSEGYALCLGTSISGYNVDEIYFDAISPFESDKELPVYVGSLTLYSYLNGVYRDARTNEVIISTVDYQGTTAYDGYFDEIYYERKSTAQVSLYYGIPFYTATSYLNSCACVAGSTILGYYDRMYSYIIPNFNSYSTTSGAYVFGCADTLAVADQLYYDMKTNIYNGTSFSNFIIGMQTYLSRVNRSMTYTSVLTSGNLDYDKLTSALAQQRPVAIFMSGYNVVDDYSGTEYDCLYVTKYSGGHVMVAYGYKNISYYRTETKTVWSPVWYNPFRTITVTYEVNFRSDNYLKVSSGVIGSQNAYVRLYQDNESLDYAASIYIY
jgi:hypothetical protein